MKRLFIFTYPKLTIYLLAVVGAYFIFQIPSVTQAITSFNGLIYLAVFFAGLLYSAGFSTALATGFFLAFNPTNPYVFALVGGLGALVADLGIFSFIRLSFMGEFKRLKRSAFIRHLNSAFIYIVPGRIRTFLVYVFVAIVIASPLPDELAVAMLAGFTKLHPYGFMIMSYVGNTIGIFLLLLI
jgi:hypothetical protein